MIASQPTTANNLRSDSELCRNACGFYGNRIWDGFCSKCYREVYQQAKQIQEVYDGKSTNSTSDPTGSPSISSQNPEKRRSHLSMRNPIRQIVHRAGTLRSSSSTSSLFGGEQNAEEEFANKYLESISNEDARLDFKNQVKTFNNHFSKLSSNKSIDINILIQDYSKFRETIKKRIATNEMYRDENEDLLERVRDYVELIVFTKNYSFIFDRLAMIYEEQDLSIQNRISSLHWITPSMLDAVLHEDVPEVRESLYKAMNALIELDSKRTPQEKIHSIMECKSFIEEALRTCNSTSIAINADSFLPALIYVVLQAKPPRLQSNMQFLSQFSQPNGEQLYYLANLDSAVRFIELVQAEHLGLSSNDFTLYMRGEPVLPCEYVSLFDYPVQIGSHLEQIEKNSLITGQLDHQYEKFNENLRDFQRRLNQSFSDVREFLNNSYARWSPFNLEKSSVNMEQKPIIDQTESTSPSDSNLIEKQSEN